MYERVRGETAPRLGRASSFIPGCNPSLALRCERCWLASVPPRPHPGRWLLPQVPHYVVQCPVLWIMLVGVRGSPVPVSRPRRPSAKPDDLWCRSMLLRRWRWGFLHAVPAGRRGTSAARNFRTPSVFKNLSLPPSSVYSELRRSQREFIWPQLFGSLRSPDRGFSCSWQGTRQARSAICSVISQHHWRSHLSLSI